MENYNLHRRAQSGWHPTSYSRKPMPDAPRERNWAALMEAAKRKPRTDNDALEAKFGESAKGRPAGFELAREGSSPSSPAIPDGARGEDLYEPVGTMPVVGDVVWCAEGLVKITRIDSSLSFSVRFNGASGQEDGLLMSYFSDQSRAPLRILKRKHLHPTPQRVRLGAWRTLTF